MPATTVLDPDGHFKWDYLQCKDLKYPSLDDFKTNHVYKEGEVFLRSGTPAQVHGLCVGRKLKDAAEPASSRDQSLLRSAGFVLEPVPCDAAFYAARNTYHVESARREAEFKLALFEREGLTGNPKAEMLYSKAYERSHSSGLAEVANTFIDLAELIR